MQEEARNASKFEGYVYHKMPSVPNDPVLLEHHVRIQNSERVNQYGVPLGSKVYYQCDTLNNLRAILIILRATLNILSWIGVCICWRIKTQWNAFWTNTRQTVLDKRLYFIYLVLIAENTQLGSKVYYQCDTLNNLRAILIILRATLNILSWIGACICWRIKTQWNAFWTNTRQTVLDKRLYFIYLVLIADNTQWCFLSWCSKICDFQPHQFS